MFICPQLLVFINIYTLLQVVVFINTKKMTLINNFVYMVPWICFHKCLHSFINFCVHKHLFFVVYKQQHDYVYKRSYYGLKFTIFGVKKLSSNLQNFDFSTRTYSSVGFFGLYWSGQPISFFPLFVNGDILTFMNSIYCCHLNNFVY